MATHKLAIIGYGKIAQDQHIPAIQANAAFELAAVVSGHAKSVPGVPRVFSDAQSLYNEAPEIGCVALCGPPAQRYGAARQALLAGKHVFLEKPPAATIEQARILRELASERSLTLFASWHARANPAVEEAARRLKGQAIRSLVVTWKEDVRRWHPGQDWILGPGGFGIFDPGINALSVVTAILPGSLFVTSAKLAVPANRQQPIAADLVFGTEPPASGALIAAFDWRQTGPQTWAVEVETETGARLSLTDGGAKLAVDGAPVEVGEAHEYPDLYARFAELLDCGESEVDLRPFELVADAFLCAERSAVGAFEW